MDFGSVFTSFLCLVFRMYSAANLSDQYMGCYQDNERYGDLGYGDNNKLMTISSCINYCKTKRHGATFAAVQNGSKCFCGDKYGKYGFSTNCDVVCGGDSSFYCGGVLQKSVYAVCPISFYGQSCDKECHCNKRTPCNRMDGSCANGCAQGWTGKDCNTTTASVSLSYQGCYGNNASYFPFIWISEYTNNFMTIQWCMDECRAKYPLNAYLYAGLQWKFQCTCGYSNFSETGISDKCGTDCRENNCSCTGDLRQRCGGGGANDVYSACQAGYFGPSCSQQCHCANNANCSMETGDCGSSGCAKGWLGTACNYRNCNENNGDCHKDNEDCAMENLGPGTQHVVTRCRCKEGYNRTMEHEECKDINECSFGFPDNNCNPAFEACVNQEGNYTCVCYPGFSREGSASCSHFRQKYNETLIFGLALGYVAIVPLLIVIVILFIVYAKLKRKLRDQEKSNGRITLTMADEEDNSETVDLVYEELNKTGQPDNSPIYAQLTIDEMR